MHGEGRALAGEGVEGSTAWASNDRWALARASGDAVDLRRRARWGLEQTSLDVQDQVARAGGQSGAQASVVVEVGSAWARQDVAADALASELIVHLRGGAGGDDEGAGGSRVGEAALVSGVSGASAGVVVVNSVTQARGRADALALAGQNVVGLAGRARGDSEFTKVSVVVQAASVSGVSGASARRGVPGGTAEASLDLSALALADGVVNELGGQAQGWVDALAVALAVELLEARALVGALACAGDGVVDLEWVRAGSVDTDLGGVAELEGSSADAVTAVVVVGGALGRDQ